MRYCLVEIFFQIETLFKKLTVIQFAIEVMRYWTTKVILLILTMYTRPQRKGGGGERRRITGGSPAFQSKTQFSLLDILKSNFLSLFFKVVEIEFLQFKMQRFHVLWNFFENKQRLILHKYKRKSYIENYLTQVQK